MIYVLYHQSCLDGFGAAYAAWTIFGDDAEYVPVKYQEPWPGIVDSMNNIVYILDFSFDRVTLQFEEQQAKALMVIDHHKSAEEALHDLPFATFDMEHSGAVLAWKHFNPTSPIPKLLQHVEDRDLWKFEMPSTEAICEALWAHPKDFERWDMYASDPGALKRLKIEGDLLLLAKAGVVRQTCYGAFVCSVSGKKAIACNAPVHVSGVCHELLDRYPECDLAVGFRITKDQEFRWDFRSRKGSEVDVSEVAKRYGGGGHKHAAGARTKDNILRNT